MSQIIDAFFDRRKLLAIVEQWKAPQAALLNLFFKEVNVSDTKYVEIGLYDGKRRIAPMVSRKGTGQNVEAIKEQRFVYEPPYTKPKINISPSDIQKAIGGNSPYDDRTIAENMSLLVARNSRDLEEQILRREELMAMQGLVNRSIDVTNENGDQIQDSIDVPVDESFDFINSAAWSNASTGKPLEDIITARRKVAKKTGFNPTIAIHGSTAAQYFRASTTVQDSINKFYSDRGVYKAVAESLGLIHIATIDGVEHYEYAEYYIDPADGVEKELFPASKVLVGTDQGRMIRNYGAIESFNALAPMPRFLNSIPPYGRDPEVWTLQMHSAPLPFPHQSHSVCIITVT